MTDCPTILEALGQRGYRITSPRQIVVETIAHSDHHLSAEEIFSQLHTRIPGTNISTVYRTLELLWEEGFICRNDLGEGKIVYAPRHHGPHIHLVCRRCSQVIKANPDVLKQLGKTLLADYQFAADLDHLSIFGLCKNCEETLAVDHPRVDHPHVNIPHPDTK